MGFFEKLKQSLNKTRNIFTNKLDSAFNKDEKIDSNIYDELEELLILADVGIKCSDEIITQLKENVKSKKLKFKPQAKEELIEIVENILKGDESLNLNSTPSVIIMLGVNGVGKTTTIAKLAYMLKNQGKSVIMGAADTFRAAAIDQLEIWAKKIDCQIIKHEEKSDPAAVVFDTIAASKKRNISVAICDTAGRLHTKSNLMNELGKIVRIIEKEGSGISKEILLTIDATTGQNGLVQAKRFKEATKITGTILTKLDGTAKGGIVIPIKKQLGLPIKFIGTGEQLDCIQPFDANMFTRALFNM